MFMNKCVENKLSIMEGLKTFRETYKTSGRVLGFSTSKFSQYSSMRGMEKIADM